MQPLTVRLSPVSCSSSTHYFITTKLLDQYQPCSPSLYDYLQSPAVPQHYFITTKLLDQYQPCSPSLYDYLQSPAVPQHSISSPQNYLISTNHAAPHCTTISSLLQFLNTLFHHHKTT